MQLGPPALGLLRLQQEHVALLRVARQGAGGQAAAGVVRGGRPAKVDGGGGAPQLWGYAKSARTPCEGEELLWQRLSEGKYTRGGSGSESHG